MLCSILWLKFKLLMKNKNKLLYAGKEKGRGKE